jgi:formate dehydrogenase iron-sulfur subunit
MIGILVDVTRCNGCNQCVDACARANHLGADTPAPQQVGDGLSANRWSSIVYTSDGSPVRKFCRHCLEPACVSVCPVGAMIKTELGPVIYDSSRCMGCRYCMMACPFGIPRYQWDSAAPLVRKCTMCYERLKVGQLPACVEACPQQVLTFGERDELLKIAHQYTSDAAGKYLPVVYGEQEVGGTSVLYISDISLDFLSLSNQPTHQPMPDLSWNWLSKVPAVATTTTGLMAGLFWVIGRRMQAEEARAARRQKES